MEAADFFEVEPVSRPVPPPEVLAPFEKEPSDYGEDRAADRSLLGTWAHIADKSSRSRLCCLQLFPVLLTAHYSSFSLVGPQRCCPIREKNFSRRARSVSISISISISNPKRKRPKLGVSQNRSALTWAKGIQIEIEIVSRLLNLKHQTAEVSDESCPRLRWIIPGRNFGRG